MVPVTGTDVSTTNVQFWDGRAMAVGKPLSADTCTFANAIVGKMSTSQKSNVHTDAAVCVIDLVACVVFAFPLKELWAMAKTLPTKTTAAAAGERANPAFAVSVVAGDAVALLAGWTPLVGRAAAVLAARLCARP